MRSTPPLSDSTKIAHAGVHPAVLPRSHTVNPNVYPPAYNDAQLVRTDLGALPELPNYASISGQYSSCVRIGVLRHPSWGRPVLHARGEWTDDTSMAIPVLDVLARGDRIDDAASREEIVGRWIGWSRTAKDVGAQTRSVLLQIPESFTEADVCAAARAVHERAGRSGGNGALMRTGPLALGYLDRPATELAAAARAVSELTHWEADSASACILWCAAILTGELDVRGQLALLPAADAARWSALIDEALAPGAHPRDFMENNGWVVRAFQGALAAIVGATSLTDAVERAVRGGGDTDTVAAIAGALAGAVWGAAAVPAEWTRELQGWPRYAAEDLERQAGLAVRGMGPTN